MDDLKQVNKLLYLKQGTLATQSLVLPTTVQV